MALAVETRRLQRFQPVCSFGHLTPAARLFCGSCSYGEVRQYRCLSLPARIRTPQHRRLNEGEQLRTMDVAVDNNAVWFQHTTFLTRNLGLYPLAVSLTRVCLAELRRSEQPAVLHAVERRDGQEVQRTGFAEIDAMVLEALAVEIAKVERDRLGAELEQEPREPRLEHRGAFSRCR